jgi:hypothetical protein
MKRSNESENKIFKPKCDKLFHFIWIFSSALMIPLTIIAAFEPIALLVTIPVDILIAYFIISPLFGYVELREKSVFIKFGFILSREIPYEKIRGFSKARKFYSDSMLSLKNSFDHVNIKYNTFDMISVSVTDNDLLISDIEARMRSDK